MEERKHILLITLSNIGDVVLTTPVIAALRSAFHDAKLTVVVGPKAAPLLQGSKQIDRLLIYDKRAGISDKLKLIRTLREGFYDYVVDLRNSAIPFLIRANRRSRVLRFHQAHQARARHLEVLGMTKLQISENGRFDFFNEQDEANLFELLRKKGVNPALSGGVVAPGAGSENKRWKIEGFREVLAHLMTVENFPFFVVGDQGERALGEKLSSLDSQRVVNLAGELTLKELAALISRSRLVLTNDSACMHLGYELGRPVVALFGPTDSTRYGRQSKIWRIVSDPSRNLDPLSPGVVIQACEDLLR